MEKQLKTLEQLRYKELEKEILCNTGMGAYSI